jgi:hypothetical protein
MSQSMRLFVPVSCVLAACVSVACVLVVAATPARAEKHVFIVANNPDGYGIDRCLASGSTCGAAVAAAYCQSREYADATSFRRVERADVTGALLMNSAGCPNGDCKDFVAIECTR